MWLRAVGGFGFLVVIGEAWVVVEVACTFVWIFWWKVVIVTEGCWWVWIFGCGYGFPVHSFGFFVWLLVMWMVVESGFAVGGDDKTGFGCGFHVLCVELRR